MSHYVQSPHLPSMTFPLLPDPFRPTLTWSLWFAWNSIFQGHPLTRRVSINNSPKTAASTSPHWHSLANFLHLIWEWKPVVIDPGLSQVTLPMVCLLGFMDHVLESLPGPPLWCKTLPKQLPAWPACCCNQHPTCLLQCYNQHIAPHRFSKQITFKLS